MASSGPDLVGRDDELAALERAVCAVEGGSSYALGLSGEPGIGKTRLLDELASIALRRGMRVLAGRAAELEQDLPFALLYDALSPAVDDPEAQSAIGRLDAALVPALSTVLPAVGVRRGADLGPASGELHLVARAIRQLVERLSTTVPLVLVLDDVHWADRASRDVLALLLHRPPEAPVLLAMAMRTGRSPDLESALAATQQEGRGALVVPRPLSRAAAETLMPVVGPAAREKLYRDSGGNPFYLHALTSATTPLADGHLGLIPGVPHLVQAAIARELASLGDSPRLLIEAGAVAGDPFDLDVAVAVAEASEPDALRDLDALLRADLVQAAGPRRFRFRHPLLRRAVYEMSGGGWRVGAHRRAADWLERRGEPPANRAHHVARAARPGDLAAVEVLASAADDVAATAPATAAGWYAAAERVLPGHRDHDDVRTRLLATQGHALVSAGRPVEGREVLRRLLALLPPDAAAERVRVVENVADLEGLWLEDYDAARRVVMTERASLGSAAPLLTATLDFALVRGLAARSDHQGAERLATQVRRIAGAAGDPVLEAAAAVYAADAAHCALRRDDPGELARVDATIAEAELLVASLSDDSVAQRLQMLFWLGVARLFTGDFTAAAAAADRGLEVARATRQGLLAPSFLGLAGFVSQERGDLDHAERAVEEGLESALLASNRHLTYWAVLVAAWIALARGRPERAVSLAEQGWRTAGVQGWSQVGWTMAEARLTLGDPGGALAVLETFGGVNPDLWTLDRAKAAEVTVRVLLALGRVDEADAAAARAPAECGGRRAGVFGALQSHARAGVLLARGRYVEAAAEADAGVRAADDGGAALWVGRCRTLLGTALAHAGDTDAARRELRSAAEDLDARGAWGYRDAAVQQLRRLGDRPRPRSDGATPPRERLSGLTAREREVAALVTQGHTNGQIARRLQLSERTVEKHVSNLLGKLDLPSRTALAAVWSLTGPS